MSNQNEQLPACFQHMDSGQVSSYRLAAGFVEKEVAKGREVDEVLEEEWNRSPGGMIWYDPEALRHFSPAVEATFKTSPIPLRMPNRMRLALEKEARNTKLPRSEVMRQLLQEALDARERDRASQASEAGVCAFISEADRAMISHAAREIVGEIHRRRLEGGPGF